MTAVYRILYLLDEHTSIAPIEADEAIRVQRLSVGELDRGSEDAWQAVREADFILLLTHGSIAVFRSYTRLRQMLRASQMLFVQNSMEDEMQEIIPTLSISWSDYHTILRYIKSRSRDNLRQLHRYLAHRFAGLPYSYEPVQLPRWQGLYDPDIGEELDAEAYLRLSLEAKRRGEYVCGLIFAQYLVATDNLLHINALIRHLRSLGVFVLPLYTTASIDATTGERGLTYAVEQYLYHQGELLPDVLINTMPYSLGIFEPTGAVWQGGEQMSLLERLGLPVLQAYTTYFSASEWRERVEGLDTISLISSVYYPEFDGQINGYPIGSREHREEDGLSYFAPLDEGIDVVARLATRWARLRHLPHAEKRVAIILHNMPPRNDSIGSAAGLDSPASVLALLGQMEQMGIEIGRHYESGDELISEIISGVSNDLGWLGDDEVLQRAVAKIPTRLYQRWYEALESKTQEALLRSWGDAPGDFRVLRDQMPVPGVMHGKLFIGLQPPRGYEEHAEEIYHSTDICPPHYYIAFYRWVRYVFEADLIIHIGTHGSLEWLPGKEKGLSKACFPQVSIDDLPHLYLYNTAVIGEGIQAKRRSAAVLLNHLEPSSQESGTYDELADLDGAITRYLSGSLPDAQALSLREEILAQARELSLDKDIEHIEVVDSPEEMILALHRWIGVIKQSMVKDGLHIFGEPPRGELLDNYLRVLVRRPIGQVPSLPQALAAYYGYDYDELRAEPERRWPCGRTSVMVIDQLIERARSLVKALSGLGYTQTPTAESLRELLGEGGELAPVEAVLELMSREVYPRLQRTREELSLFALGAGAGFVLPGQGGSPTRGNLGILPTGRNMYAIDPGEIPSHAAYKTGQRLGEQLLARYQRDEGKLPESIAIVLYSGDQMRTYGEDIAEILWLMGLRPVWLSDTSDRVLSLEVIPLEELGRARIDVVCRISGLLRDTFPTIIQLLDEAVRLVIALDEDPQDNFVKKHYEEDLGCLLSEGIDPAVAMQEAAIRVFGCPPGTYGGGVDAIVESKQWESSDDLGTVAITWGAHAYTSELHGTVSRRSFERQLSKVQATVKNENIINFDLFDVDDEFIYHGGLIAAVKKCSGRPPRSYYGNSSDPDMTVVRSVQEEAARVLRSRVLNPLWIEGLKRHGYRGARDLSYNMDNIFGWDATSDIIEDWSYEAIAEHLLGKAEHRDWIAEVNPWALGEIAERLLEAAQRGLWQASAETLEMVEAVYLHIEGLLEQKNE